MANAGLGEEVLRLGAIEARVDPRDVLERLIDPDPAGQHGDVGDEAHVAHQLVALGPGIAAEHPELPLEGEEAEHRVERRGLSRAVGPDDAQDAPFLDAEIDAVQCDGIAVGLAQAAYFDGGHSLKALPDWRSPAAPRT